MAILQVQSSTMIEICMVKVAYIVKRTYTLSDNNYIARQYGFDVQHEWDFRGGKDYFIAGVLGKRETYRTTSGPYYGNPHRNSYAIYGTYSYQINPKWTSI